MFMNRKINPRPNVDVWVFNLYCMMNFNKHIIHPNPYTNSPNALTLSIYFVAYHINLKIIPQRQHLQSLQPSIQRLSLLPTLTSFPKLVHVFDTVGAILPQYQLWQRSRYSLWFGLRGSIIRIVVVWTCSQVTR